MLRVAQVGAHRHQYFTQMILTYPLFRFLVPYAAVEAIIPRVALDEFGIPGGAASCTVQDSA